MPENIAHADGGHQPHALAGLAVEPAAGLALGLAEALAMRICHDLAGGLGTLMGTLELARDDADMLVEALPLAHETASRLSGRLRLMRAAWGGGDVVDIAELREIAAGIPTPRRVRIVLDDIAPDAGFNRYEAQLLLNLLLLGVEAVAGEGVVRGASRENAILISLAGPQTAWPEGFAGQLLDPGVALHAAAKCGPRHLQGPLAALIAHQNGISLTMLQGGNGSAPPLRMAARGE